ncbi:MAG: hypothetical protein RLY14_1825 [Planctomycetota bacterium]
MISRFRIIAATFSFFLFAYLPNVVVYAGDFTLTTLDGKSFDCEVLELEEASVSVAVVGKNETYKAEQIKQLKRASSGAAVIDSLAPLLVRLRDGSELRAGDVRKDGKQIVLSPDGEKPEEGKISIPEGEVEWIRFRETSANNQNQWNELIASTSKTDRLVVLRAGDVVDSVEGVVVGIDEKEIRFDFDGESIKAPKSKLLGVTFFALDKKSYAPARVIVRTTSGHMLSAVKLRKQTIDGKDGLAITTSGAIDISIPWGDLAELDYSAGNLKLCSELSPLSSKWIGDKDYPGDKEIAQKIFSPHVERYGTAGSAEATAASDYVFLGSGEVVFRVPEGMNRFQTTIAGAPGAQVRGWTTVIVKQEDEVIFQQSFRPEVERMSIDVAVSGKRRVTLITQPDDKRQAEDAIWWLQPRFVK